MEILAVISLVLAGVSKGVRDRVMTGWTSSKFEQWGFARSWWDSALSWRNKWKLKNGYPTGKERFPLSSTVLVCLTDAWHCFDLTSIVLFAIGVWASSLNPVFCIIIMLASFQLSYTALGRK